MDKFEAYNKYEQQVELERKSKLKDWKEKWIFKWEEDLAQLAIEKALKLKEFKEKLDESGNIIITEHSEVSEENTPKVFISYSRSWVEHEAWVTALAEKLRDYWIDARYDKWDLKLWHDINKFIEIMETDKNVVKVLVICDRKYKEKADDRKAWVGKETKIIWEKVYSNANQQKFIPILREKDSLPIYMQGNYYVDFTDDDTFEEAFETLIRDIHNKPLHEKPAMWNKHLELLQSKTVSQVENELIKVVKKIRYAIENWLPTVTGFTKVFLWEIYKQILAQKNDDKVIWDYDDLAFNSIEKILPLRDLFIETIDYIFLFEVQLNPKIFYDFFSQILLISDYTNESWINDNIDFINQELFLYFVSILLKYKRYDDLDIILYSPYNTWDTHGRKFEGWFDYFNSYLSSFEETRNRKLNQKRLSIFADTIKERAQNDLIPFEHITNSDMFLYFMSKYKQALWMKSSGRRFPRLYFYIWRRSTYFGNEFFANINIKDHFNSIKSLLKVNNYEELKENLSKIKEDSQRWYAYCFESYPEASSAFSIQ